MRAQDKEENAELRILRLQAVQTDDNERLGDEVEMNVPLASFRAPKQREQNAKGDEQNTGYPARASGFEGEQPSDGDRTQGEVHRDVDQKRVVKGDPPACHTLILLHCLRQAERWGECL